MPKYLPRGGRPYLGCTQGGNFGPDCQALGKISVTVYRAVKARVQVDERAAKVLSDAVGGIEQKWTGGKVGGLIDER